MQSKYWEIDSANGYYIELTGKDNPMIKIDLFKTGFCAVKQDDSFMVEVDSLTQFIAMMQEAHELARQHFGEQWGKRDE